MKNKIANILKITFIVSIMLFTFSCRNINKDLAEEIATMQKSCPQNMGNGATLTNVKLLETEKMIEYYITMSDMETLERFDDEVIIALKDETIKKINEDITNENEEIISLKNLLEEHEYNIRYIFSNTKEHELGRLEINKNNL